MRRRSPPWGAIEAFVVASRATSFKQAAAQLALSGAAFSRRIQTLEEHLGVRLFDRTGSAAGLTAAGLRYLERLQPSYESIRAATEWMAPDPERRAIRIGVSQSLAAGWLVPRLPHFYAQTHGIELVLQTWSDQLDLISGATDLRILYGFGDWDQLYSEKLMDLEAFPVCASRMTGGRSAPRTLGDLNECTLIELVHPPNQWDVWLQGTSCQPSAPRLVFDSALVAYEAAAQGMGVALGVPPLVNEMLRQGRVNRVLDVSRPMAGAFYMAALPEFRRHKAIQTVWRWLLSEVARDQAPSQQLRLVAGQ